MEKKAADNFSIKATRFAKVPPPPILPKRDMSGKASAYYSACVRVGAALTA